MVGNLTKNDEVVLRALIQIGHAGSSGLIARVAGIHTASPCETAARHCIKLTKLGFALKSGSRMFPEWEATDADRTILKQEQSNDD